MTMRVTMLNARRGEGVDLIAGQTYTVSDALGAQLVGAGHATDTDKALTPVGSEPVRASTNPLTGGIELSAGGVRVPTPVAHQRYHFHGFAGNQFSDDTAFFDMSGAGNHGAFGANLSKAQAWANAGYVSTVDPATGVTDSVIRIPAPNWDYRGGESLLIMWVGQVTPEGGDTTLMGTTAASTSSGIRIRCKSTGQLDFVLYENGGTSVFTGSSTATAAGKPFVAGEIHSFGILINGQTRQYAEWVDGLLNVPLADVGTKQDVNTLSSNPFTIGSGSPSPGGTEGIASKTRAFALLRFGATDPMPSVATITSLMAQFRAAPARLVLDGAI